jgi:hypothetical protein
MGTPTQLPPHRRPRRMKRHNRFSRTGLALPSTGPLRPQGCRLAGIVPFVLAVVALLSWLLGTGLGAASASGTPRPPASSVGSHNLRLTYTGFRQKLLRVHGGKRTCGYIQSTGTQFTDTVSWTAHTTHSVEVEITRTRQWEQQGNCRCARPACSPTLARADRDDHGHGNEREAKLGPPGRAVYRAPATTEPEE